MAYTDIDDASEHFQVATYNSNSGYAVSVVNDGNSDLKPDLLWVKSRETASGYDYNHNLIDSSRGRSKTLYIDTTAAEMTASQSNYDLASFDTDGFTNGAPEYTNSLGGHTVGKVAWQWKANAGTTASNSDGNITSTVQANTEAGFSIVTWTGNESSSATVGHGLNQKPETIFFKRRNNGTYNWTAQLLQLGLVGSNTYVGYPNLANSWEQTTIAEPTSTVIKPGSGAPQNSGDMLAYCWHGVKGYSKFGSYYGNSSVDGPVVYTGFKPALVIIKGNVANHWIMYDNKRPGYNGVAYELYCNLNHPEYTGASYFDIDLLSNGFKLKLSDGSINSSGNRYAYMAWAENPFISSAGTPTTAR